MHKKMVQGALILFAALIASAASATTFNLPTNGDTVVGSVQVVVAKYEDTLSDIGRKFGIGYEEMIGANPGVDPWLPGAGTRVVIPQQFVLPDAPRKGIVVNLPEHRLYYFPDTKHNGVPVVMTYPISVGKMDWKTPVGLTRIISKQVDPAWYPPESVRLEHEKDGRPLPKVIPPGPDNPLGQYAMRLDIPGGSYLIHGTNLPVAVGMPVTHGCIRMFPEDIEALFKIVPVKTPVRIVRQASKAGWLGNTLYIEVHPESDDAKPAPNDLTAITRALVAATETRKTHIDWARAEQVFEHATGIPVALTPPPAEERTADVDR